MEMPVSVTILAFGQIAEDLGSRKHEMTVDYGTTVKSVIQLLGQQHWLGQGLAVAIDGNKVELDYTIHKACEIAILPPVSGG